MSKARFVFIMGNKTVGFRTPETDKYPLSYPLIDDETASVIDKGLVSGDAVAEAITKGIMSKPGFNWEDFDKRRQAEKKLLNVSQHDMAVVGDKADNSTKGDEPEDVVSLASLGLAKPKSASNSAPADVQASAKPASRKSEAKSSIDAALGL